MAYLDDDFQSYTIGDHLPLGSWTNGGSFTDVIVAGGPSGTTRSLQMQGIADYDRGSSFLTTWTEFVAIRKLSEGEILRFDNGPNLSGHSFTLLSLSVERDKSITAVCPASGQILANSGDFGFDFYAWNFLQVNVTVSDFIDPMTLIPFLQVDCEVALNGVSIFSFSTVTTFDVTQLTNGISEVNHFQLVSNGAFYCAYTLDTPQPIVSYPHPGMPNMIVHQGAGEVIELPDDANVWIQQGVIELILGLGHAYISES